MAFEIGTALIGFGGVIIGGLISSGTTWFIARNERHKFARERTWDLRREAYTKIIGHLVAASSWAKLMNDNYKKGYPNYENSSAASGHGEQFSHFMKEAKKEYTINRLILSNGFAKTFDHMFAALEGIQLNIVLPDSAEQTWQLLNQSTDALMAIGLHETVAYSGSTI